MVDAPWGVFNNNNNELSLYRGPHDWVPSTESYWWGYRENGFLRDVTRLGGASPTPHIENAIIGLFFESINVDRMGKYER